MALFITFEGGDGCGKSTHARVLYRRLSKLAMPAVLTQEPGGTTFGRRIARFLKWSDGHSISPLGELLLFNASRAELVSGIIRPGLKEGKIVICDRYTDSTIAYQGYGRGLDLATVQDINNTASGGLKPGLTILLDMPVAEGLARKKNTRRDRIEQEDPAFHQRVRRGYLKLAAEEPGRWLVVDATKPRGEVTELIWQRVSELLRQQGA